MRDAQRSKVYKAENAVFPMHTPTMNEGEVLSFRDEIIDSKHWYENKGYKRVKFFFRGGMRSKAWFRHEDKSISIPPWAMNKHIIIHEMAHSLTHRKDEDVAGHGKFFCQEYLALTNELLGGSLAEDLEISFLIEGVRY